MNLVEVTICDQVFVIAFDADTTIARLAEVALAEYQAAFFERVPSKVKYVQDHKRRILSGTLLVADDSVEKALIVELIDSDAGGARRPPKDDVCGQFRMWQEYSAIRAKQCLESMADSPSRVDPSNDFLDMLQDLRRSRFQEVQTHTVEALCHLLDYFRNKKFTMFAMQELQMVVNESVFPNVALAALRKISTSRTCHRFIFPSSRLAKDIDRVLKLFDESVHSEFFDLLDYLESEAAQKIDFIADEELRTAERNSRCPAKGSTYGNFKDDDLTPQADAKEVQPRPEITNKESEKSASDDPELTAANVDRILSCLTAEEQKNRQYGIRKAVALVWWFAAESSDVTICSIVESKLSRLVGSLLACLKMSLKPDAAPRSRDAKDGGNGSVEQAKATLVAAMALSSPLTDILTVQLALRCLCLVSICRPRLVRHVLLRHQHSSGNYCKLLTTLAHSRDSYSHIDTNGDGKVEDLVKMMKSHIAKYKRKAVCYGISGVSGIYALPVADAASMLLLVAMKEENVLPDHEKEIELDEQYIHDTDSGSMCFNEIDALESSGFDMSADAKWSSGAADGCGIKLEPRAVAQLLQTDTIGDRNSIAALMAPLRVEFALAYLLHTSLLVTAKVHSGGRDSQSGRPDMDASSDIYSMLSSHDFNISKLLWRWLSSGCRRVSTLATSILANVTTNTVIRSFFLQNRSTVPKVNPFVHIKFIF